ncbi:tyrosine-type recombinase/integrase [Paracidovorax citrulli]|uniref:tyrosine-type recombinase/integrase n=1 Tax=Paracidovorax citrulli TaxID=80869 RepID=UPI00255C8093|nr:tyrosine-type recombinase/integrase [Paracidovorax citrulli]WIY36635.1 tyrosine-type recombinase/integrase [Paracidovorax citrulli]
MRLADAMATPWRRPVAEVFMDGGMREPGIETQGRGEGWDPRFDDLLMQAAAEEGLADDSLRALQTQLRCFNAWVLAREGRSWDRATADDLKAYFQEARELRSAATVRLKRWVVQRLYRWARAEGIVDVSFEAALVAVRSTPPMRLTTVPSVDQMRRILSLPDTGTPTGVRDRAALELLYGAGLRSAELLGLHVAQVPDAPGMRLVGKGAKERLVILGEHARHWIAQYKTVRRTLLGTGGHRATATDRLFVSAGAHPDYQYSQLRRMVGRYAAMIGLHLTPHSLRHAFATHLYQHKAPLKTIQLLLGHEHLATTTIYVSRQSDDDAELLSVHHPRGGKHYFFKRWEDRFPRPPAGVTSG